MNYEYKTPSWCAKKSERDREIEFLLTTIDFILRSKAMDSTMEEKETPLKILDVGFAGAGYIHDVLALGNIEFTGLDSAIKRITGGKLRIPRVSEDGKFDRKKWDDALSKIKYVEGNIINYHSRKKYDIVASISTLEHIVPKGYELQHAFDPYIDLKAVANMKRLIKKGGYLLLTFPCGKECILTSQKFKTEIPIVKSRHDILVYDRARIDKVIGNWSVAKVDFWINTVTGYEKSFTEEATQHQHIGQSAMTLCNLLLKKES